MSAVLKQLYGTGRRKESVARVFLFPGEGKVSINQNSLEGYFGQNSSWSMIVRQPLALVGDLASKFDLYITVKGGGNSGQAGAIRLGISRAFLQYDEMNEQGLEFRKKFRQYGFLTSDDRRVERKKAGLRKARKRKQYSKR